MTDRDVIDLAASPVAVLDDSTPGVTELLKHLDAEGRNRATRSLHPWRSERHLSDRTLRSLLTVLTASADSVAA